jgi:hypothetical protein
MALVVVKQSGGTEGPKPDPGRLAQSVLNGLSTQGVKQIQPDRHLLRGPAPGRPAVTRGICAALGLVCLCLAGWTFYLGSK